MISEKDGLDHIVLSNFKNSCGPFDESLLERFVNSSIKLKKLEVNDMNQMKADSRQQLVNMIVKIIQTNLLTHLNLKSFSFDKDGE